MLKIFPSQHWLKENRWPLGIAVVALLSIGLTFSLIYYLSNSQDNFIAPAAISTDNRSRQAAAASRLQDIKTRLIHPSAPIKSRYTKLDEQIDKYLAAFSVEDAAQARAALQEADRIALEMEQLTKERFGKDMVNYYRGISSTSVKPLQDARRLRAKIEEIKDADHFAESQESIRNLKQCFQQLAASCEVELIDIQIAKYLAKTNSTAETKTFIDNGLNAAANSEHLLTQARLLLWQAEYFNNISNFTASIASLERAIRIVAPLNVPDLHTNLLMLISSVYYVTNDDQKAFQYAYQALKIANDANVYCSTQTVQVLGGAAFNLQYPALADEYLNFSITLAETRKQPVYLSVSYNLLGIIRAEQQRFAESERAFSQAFAALDQIIDLKARAISEFSVSGYYARAQMLAKNPEKAIKYYQTALDLASKNNLQEKLLLSQIHQGLGECFLAKGEKRPALAEMELAVDLHRQAQANFEVSNALLTFAVTRQHCEDQLQSIRSTTR